MLYNRLQGPYEGEGAYGLPLAVPSGYWLPLGDAPKDVKVAVWTIYGLISFSAFVTCGLTVLALCSNKSLLRMPFMRLALFLVIPDALNGFGCMQCLLHLFEVTGLSDSEAVQPDVASGYDGWHGWGQGFLWKIGIGLSYIFPQLQTGQAVGGGNITNPVTDVILPIARGGGVKHYLDDMLPGGHPELFGGVNASFGAFSYAHTNAGRDRACDFQAQYLDWCFTASMFMGILIAFQLRRMLVASSQGRPYTYTTMASVGQSLFIYALAAMMTAITYNVSPVVVVNYRGLFCTFVAPAEVPWPSIMCNDAAPCNLQDTNGERVISTAYYDREWYVNGVTFLITFYIPCAILILVVVEVFAVRKLHTKIAAADRKAAKSLVMFFAKLLLVYIVCWIPTFIVHKNFSIQLRYTEVTIVFVAFNHIAGIASAVIYLREPMIWWSLKRVLCCGRVGEPPNSLVASSSSSSSSSSYQ